MKKMCILKKLFYWKNCWLENECLYPQTLMGTQMTRMTQVFTDFFETYP